MSAVAASPGLRRAELRVAGVVQGVGFRPHVYRLARELGLAGYVLNDTHGVLVEVEGPGPAVETFVDRLRSDAPPLAVIESLIRRDRPPEGAAGFVIRPSASAGLPDAAITADSTTCPDCLRELFDPADRRFRYPFTNCTNCGPRFTIVRGIPYDRPLTTMAAFRMCARCQAEYDDPADRRFHAQPNACPECGPRVTLDGPSTDGDPVTAAARALAAGEILAVKGIGGYHLACRADTEAVVARLRARKHREDKPFAVMVASPAAADALAELNPAERALLESPARPVVLLRRRAGSAIAASVAPRARELGLMLPYSPLHHLLMADLAGFGVRALVLTSGNLSDEPIAFADADAQERLAPIADRFLIHDRPIETRTDDSVLRAVSVRPGGPARPLMVRRSRGYVPASVRLPEGTPRPLLGCGAELKHTFCVAKGERAWVSHHIGDLQNYETLRSFHEGVAHFERMFAVRPEVLAHDLHPGYLSTAYAEERPGVELIGVQHHHAHLAACLAEHGESGPAVGAIFDGTGYGEDGTVWGGELLLGDRAAFTRAGHLLPVPLPGGERAIRQPWRMACAWLGAAGDGPPARPASLRGSVGERPWAQIADLARTGLRSPLTSSMGRLFDGVAALCGIRPEVRYEGQAAIEFEALCADEVAEPYPAALSRTGTGVVIDPRETIAAVLADLAAGITPAVIATRFHAAVAAVTVRACAAVCAASDTTTVVLSGGVFQNRRLLEATAHGLAQAGLRVLIPERLPIGDGGIAYGQVAVAAARLREARR